MKKTFLVSCLILATAVLVFGQSETPVFRIGQEKVGVHFSFILGSVDVSNSDQELYIANLKPEDIAGVYVAGQLQNLPDGVEFGELSWEEEGRWSMEKDSNGVYHLDTLFTVHYRSFTDTIKKNETLIPFNIVYKFVVKAKGRVYWTRDPLNPAYTDDRHENSIIVIRVQDGKPVLGTPHLQSMQPKGD